MWDVGAEANSIVILIVYAVIDKRNLLSQPAPVSGLLCKDGRKIEDRTGTVVSHDSGLTRAGGSCELTMVQGTQITEALSININGNLLSHVILQVMNNLPTTVSRFPPCNSCLVAVEVVHRSSTCVAPCHRNLTQHRSILMPSTAMQAGSVSTPSTAKLRQPASCAPMLDPVQFKTAGCSTARPQSMPTPLQVRSNVFPSRPDLPGLQRCSEARCLASILLTFMLLSDTLVSASLRLSEGNMQRGVISLYPAVASVKNRRNTTLRMCSELSCQTSKLIASMLKSLITSVSATLRVNGKNRRKRIIVLIIFCAITLGNTSPFPGRAVSIRGSQTPDGAFVAQLRGSPNTGYCVLIQIGTPGNQEFCVLVDTGSANLAIAGRDDANINDWFRTEKSSTYEDLGKTAKVSYTSGKWEGKLSSDVISVDGSLEVRAYLVVITKATDFYINEAEWVGILGMAYSKLAKPNTWVQTFWDSYRAANNLQNVFSLQLCPPLDVPILPQESATVPQDGWMVLGGIDKTYYHDQRGIHYTSIVKEEFYNVLITNLTVGDTAIKLKCREFNNDQTIVDSGTTDIFLPETVFKEVTKTFAAFFADGAPLEVPEDFWTGGKKLAWPVDDLPTIYSAFPTFNIGFAAHNNASMEFSLAVTPQLYLRQVKGTNEQQQETNCYPDCDFFTFGIKQRERGTVLGSIVMLGFYCIFDQGGERVGFAESTCKYQDDYKDSLPKMVGPYHRAPDDCECHHCGPEVPDWELWSYVCGGIVITLALISIIIAVWTRVKDSKRARCIKCKKYKSPVREEGGMEEENDSTPLIREESTSNSSEEVSIHTVQIEIEDDTVDPKNEFSESATDPQLVLGRTTDGSSGDDETEVETSAVNPNDSLTDPPRLVEPTRSKLPEYPQRSQPIAPRPPTVRSDLQVFTDDSSQKASGSSSKDPVVKGSGVDRLKVIGLRKTMSEAERVLYDRLDSAIELDDESQHPKTEDEPTYTFQAVSLPFNSESSLKYSGKLAIDLGHQVSDDGYDSPQALKLLSIKPPQLVQQLSISSVGSDKGCSTDEES